MQVVEVNDVILHRLRTDDQVAQQPRVRRRRRADGVSTARIDAIAWTVVQTPQMRCVNAHASRGSRPFRMISMPRNIVDDDQASCTAPPIDFGLDAQMSLDAGDRIDDHSSHRQDSLLRGATGSALSPTRFMI